MKKISGVSHLYPERLAIGSEMTVEVHISIKINTQKGTCLLL